jgi:hypothetical protein
MKKCAFVIAVLALGAPARARMWTDPSFEEMVEKSELIALVEVVEGGKFSCKARCLEVLKGEDPGGAFLLAEYNVETWPAEGIEKESLRKGDRLLAFLHRAEIRLEGGTVKGWAVPTPSTGDFRVIDGKLHGSWHDPSYPHSKPGADAALVLSLVRGYLLHLEKKPPAEARKLIAEKLDAGLLGSVEAPMAGDVENASRAATASWLLCAQAAYGEKGMAPVIVMAAGSKHPLVRTCAARTLPSCGESKECLEALGKLLLDPEGLVQAEAVRSLISGGYRRENAVPLLLKALPSSSIQERGSGGIMDPLRNRSASCRELVIRGLTRFGAEKEAHDGLVKMLRDEDLPEGTFLALSDHFLKYPSKKARAVFLSLYGSCPEKTLPYFHRYLLREKSPAALQAVGERLREIDDLSGDFLEALGALAVACPAGDALPRKTLLALMEKHEKRLGDGRSVPPLDLVAFAIVVPDEEVGKRLDGFPAEGLRDLDRKKLEVIREAARLARSPTPAGEDRVDAWIALLGKCSEDPRRRGSLARLLLRAVGRSTPPEHKEYAAGKLRERYRSTFSEAAEAVRIIGGKLTAEEERVLEKMVGRNGF